MAPSSPNNHLLKEAGRHSDELNDAKPRGKRYFGIPDTIKEHKLEDSSPSELPTARTARSAGDAGGLTSAEISAAYSLNHRFGKSHELRRGRRHICHGGCLGQRTPSEPSLASDTISESSAEYHLGHRDKVLKADLVEKLREVVDDQEPTGGCTSHHLARRKGRLGFGKRHFGHEDKNTHHHSSVRINDPGGDDAFFHDGKFTSFLGPAKRHHGKTFEHDHAFDDQIEETEMAWRHAKKHFENKNVIVHGTDKTPLGVSEQVDLHSSGLFLGGGRHHFGGEVHRSQDPISHRESPEVVDEGNRDAYGLSHRGKRKFLVQNNLSHGCRINEACRDSTPSPKKSVSTPDLQRLNPQSDAPYYQDAYTPEKQSQKPLVKSTPRQAVREFDNTWSALVWAGRGVDEDTANKFIEGKELAKKDVETFREEEFKMSMGNTKRNFGNIHNKSDFRMDYSDNSAWRADDIVEIPLGETDRHDALELRTHPLNYFKWGHGHGRRKFKVNDHLDKDNDGIECYLSVDGTVLSRMKHKKVTDHLDVDAPLEVQGFFLDPDGRAISFKPRHHVVQKDTVNELLEHDVKSETSSTLGVTGQKRKKELARPTSSRRFPYKENFRPPTRAASQPKLSGEKARWKA